MTTAAPATAASPVQEGDLLRDHGARLLVFDAIFRGARDAGLPPLRFWQPTIERLRHRLGTGLSDAAVPVSVSADIPRAFHRALTTLTALVISRHRAVLGEQAYDRLIVTAPPEVALRTPPVFFSVPVGVANPRLRAAIAGALDLCPYLDSGVLMAWLAGKEAGAHLLQVVAGLLRRAVAEAARSGEETPYLVQLCLARYMRTASEVPRAMQLDGTAAVVVEMALAVGLHVVHYTAVEQVLTEAANHGTPVDRRLACLMRTLVTPVLTLGGNNVLRRFGTLLYGIDQSVYRAADGDTHLRLLSEGASPVQTADELLRATRADRDVRFATEQWIAVDAVRSAIRAVLADDRWVPATEGGPELRDHLWALYREPAQVLALLRDRRRPVDFVRLLEGRLATLARGVTARPLVDLSTLIKGYKPQTPLRALGAAADAAVLRFGRGFSCMLCDVLVERAIHPHGRIFVDRGEYRPASEMELDYQSGRLYLLAREDQPILAQRVAAPDMGHLFVDIKDFTKRTVLLNADVMADFLSREFYKPILAAARRYYKGMGHLWDRGGVTVNNLLGDAISFSGDIVAVVGLARDIRETLRAYEQQLGRVLTSDALQPIVNEVNRRYDAQRVALANERAEIEVQLKAVQATVGPPSTATLEELCARREWLLAEGQRLEVMRAEEIERVGGAELQAGIFISYGGPPRVIEIADPDWGTMRVSIAEKINESARGTARHEALRGWLDAFVAQQRTQPGFEEFQNPFRIIVGGIHGAPDGFYNIGVGLSLEALRAYVDAGSDRTAFLDRAMTGIDIHPEIVRRFCLPRGRLDLVVGFDRRTWEVTVLFAYAGAARFKGFEQSGTTDVYEMLTPDNGLYQALVRLHGAEWQRTVAGLIGPGPAPAPGATGVHVMRPG
jgi:hypothetical protein